MAPAKRRTKRAKATGTPRRRAAAKAARPEPGHNKPPLESEAPLRSTPSPMPPRPADDQTTTQVARDMAEHRRRQVAPITGGTLGQGGPPFAAARDPQTLHRA